MDIVFEFTVMRSLFWKIWVLGIFGGAVYGHFRTKKAGDLRVKEKCQNEC